jgi:hypothetical protein
LELIFYVVKTREFNRSHNAEVVSVVVPMLVVITHYAAVIANVQRMVDVRQVVTRYLTMGINPDLSPKLAIASFLRDVVHIVDNFSISHDPLYHG